MSDAAGRRRCRCRKCCGGPRPRARISPRPSAAPGWSAALREIVGQITDGKIADYYRRDFEQKVFDSFKRRAPPAPSRTAAPALPAASRPASSEASAPCRARPRPFRPRSRPVCSARAGPGRRRARLKESGTGRACCWSDPAGRCRHGENCWPRCPSADPSLDRLRHELLNLAASGSSLEKTLVLNPSRASGNGRIAGAFGRRDRQARERRKPCRRMRLKPVSCAPPPDFREMAEWEPERDRALERFATEASEETWREAQRFLPASRRIRRRSRTYGFNDPSD